MGASEFVNVRVRSGEPVTLAGSSYEFDFAAGAVKKVTLGEWTEILSRQQSAGKPMFEIAETIPARAPLAGDTALRSEGDKQ